jgi:hypothetical protein
MSALEQHIEKLAERVKASLGCSMEEARRLALESLKTKTVRPDHGTGH